MTTESKNEAESPARAPAPAPSVDVHRSRDVGEALPTTVTQGEVAEKSKTYGTRW